MQGSIVYLHNRPYISSREAGRLAGYTNDYIARLCRLGELKGERVGRVWFVDQDAFRFFLSAHSKGKQEWHQELSDERRKEYKRNLTKEYIREVFQKFGVLPLFTGDTHKRALALALSLVLVFGTYLTLQTPEEKRLASLSPVQVIAGLTTSLEKTSILVYRTFSAIRPVADGASSATAFEFIRESFANLPHYLTKAWNKARDLAYAFLFDKGSHYASTNKTPETLSPKENESMTLALGSDSREGLVVVPAPKNEAERVALSKRIKQSFSDEVRVIPDEDGQAGIIQPVFKKTLGEGYLYVLVPIDEKE